MLLRFILFSVVLTIVLCAVTYYIGLRFIKRVDWLKKYSRWWWGSLFGFAMFQLVMSLLSRIYPEPFLQWTILPVLMYGSLGFFACLLFYVLAVDTVLFFTKYLSSEAKQTDYGRRGFVSASVVAFFSSILGMFQAVSGPKVCEVEIPLANLPKEFDGFKIVQISDLHVGPLIGRAYTQNVVNIANSLGADLIALTGDFVDGTVDTLREDLTPLTQLKAKHGLFFVTGNHEYYWGAEAWCQEFRRMGFRVLLNEHAVITENQSSIVLAGVTDYRAYQFDVAHATSPSKALEGHPKDAIKILLAHQPSSYEEAFKAGVHLQLSGHTHGGQFFPWSLVVGLAHRYFKGLYNHQGMWIYVNRGTGYWGPPIRLGVPSEVTLLKLKRTVVEPRAS